MTQRDVVEFEAYLLDALEECCSVAAAAAAEAEGGVASGAGVVNPITALMCGQLRTTVRWSHEPAALAKVKEEKESVVPANQNSAGAQAVLPSERCVPHRG